MKKGILWVIVIVAVVLVLMNVIESGKQSEKVSNNTNTPAAAPVWPAEGEAIKVGMVGPLTGDLAALGENAFKAVEIATEEINNAGGINGHKIDLIAEDGNCSGKPATDAANKLIHANGVDAIIGGFCSPETLAFSGLANQKQIPMVSPCSSAPAVTDAGDYVFRVYPSDSFAGTFAADYLHNTYSAKKAAILYTNDDWGIGMRDAFQNKFEEIGGEIVAIESFEKTGRDFRTQISKIKAEDPQVLFFPSFTEAAVAGVKQLRELDLNIPTLGGDTWGDPSIWEAVGVDGEGLLFVEVAVAENDEFKTKLESKGGETTACSPHSYDAAMVLYDAIAKSGIDGESIKNQLYKTVYTQGVSSSEIKFDKNGDLLGADYIVKVIKDGEMVVAE